MRALRLFAAAGVAGLLLVAVNAALFPIVFPDGLAEKFSNPRSAPWNLYHLLALIATAFLLAYLVDRLSRTGSAWIEGVKAGGLLGLFVALPEHLHLYAMIDATAVRQFVPVVWTAVTWAIAGALAGATLGSKARIADPGSND